MRGSLFSCCLRDSVSFVVVILEHVTLTSFIRAFSASYHSTLQLALGRNSMLTHQRAPRATALRVTASACNVISFSKSGRVSNLTLISETDNGMLKNDDYPNTTPRSERSERGASEAPTSYAASLIRLSRRVTYLYWLVASIFVLLYIGSTACVFHVVFL